MYFYKLKCVVYSPDTITLPNNFFGPIPTVNLSSSKYLENYKHSTNRSTFTRRKFSQTNPPLPKNIPPTPIHSTKSHDNHSLEGQIDFRFGPIEIHESNVVHASKKKKRIDEKTIQLGYGVLHLYRDLEPLAEQDLPDTKLATEESLNITDDHHGEEDTTLCILAVPSYMSYKDFTNCLGATNSSITHYRYIRDYSANKYTVLLKFKNRQSAFACYQKFNGRRFNMTEPEISHVVYIRSNEIETAQITPNSFPYLDETISQDLLHKNLTMAELPTCPVCLERMDESITGLMSIQCHHTSQCYCLDKWGENRCCPVCQYSHKPVLSATRKTPKEEEEEVSYACCECSSIDSLWICMICGHIGCGRYQEAHAYDHYMDTNHLYALEIESQRVWDYLGDGYVHRLIQNTIDGALVELPPNYMLKHSTDGDKSYSGENASGSGSVHSGARSHAPSGNGQQGKLDTISVDYSYMLTSQLDSQRMFFENQLEILTKQLATLNNQMKLATNELSTVQAEQSQLMEKSKEFDLSIVEINKEKEKVDKRASTFNDKYDAMQKNLTEERVLTKSLLRNNELLKKDADNKESTLKELSDQVNDLMSFLESREKDDTKK